MFLYIHTLNLTKWLDKLVRVCVCVFFAHTPFLVQKGPCQASHHHLMAVPSSGILLVPPLRIATWKKLDVEKIQKSPFVQSSLAGILWEWLIGSLTGLFGHQG